MLNKIRQEFNKNPSYIISIAVIISIGLALRWTGLDARPVHHDESLHGVYGFYWFNNAETGHYKYLAMLHGPLLYFTLPFLYKILGVSTFALRTICCLLGSAFIFAPYIFRKYLSRTSLFLLISYISLSPLLIYYSRFARHDFLVIAALLFMLYGVTRATAKYKSAFFFSGLALHMATKENSFITISLIAGIFIYDYIMRYFVKEQITLVKSFSNFISKNLIYTLLGLALGTFIYIYLFSAEFRHMPGILDGLYRKSLFYWMNQHKTQRITGPFSFQSLVLFWYELPFIIITVVSLIKTLRLSTKKQLRVFLISIMAITTSYLCIKYFGIQKDLISSFFKLKIPVDYLALGLHVFIAVFITTINYLNNNRSLGILAYFFFATWFTYSYAGEKVPWLAIYPLAFGLVYFAVQFNNFTFKRLHTVFFTALLGFQLYQGVLTSHIQNGDTKEILSQVHTSYKLHHALEGIQNAFKQDHQSKVFGSPIVNWPVSWYLVGTSRYDFNERFPDNPFNYRYLFLKQRLQNLTEHEVYTEERIPLRYWFSPIYSEMTLINSFIYTIKKKPWSTVGSQDIWFYQKTIQLNK